MTPIESDLPAKKKVSATQWIVKVLATVAIGLSRSSARPTSVFRSSARNGASSNHAKPRAEIRKWPAYFQALGYEVAAFGKVSHYRHTADYGFDVHAHDGFHDPEGVPAAVLNCAAARSGS